jgi:hypothetical protein
MLEILEPLTVQGELPLERSIGETSTLAKQLDRLIQNVSKTHGGFGYGGVWV